MTRRYKLLLGTAASLIVLYLAVGLTLPGIVRSRAIAWVADNTARTLQIENIRINPFTLSLRIDGFELSEAGSEEAFVAFRRLKIKPSVWRSLSQRALVVKALSLNQPTLRIALDESGGFNFDDLRPPPGAGSEQEEPPEALLFAVSNLRITAGQADFFDAQRPELNHTVRDFNLALPFVGNTSGQIEDFITPQLSFELDGAPMAAEGEVKPFADRLEAVLSLNLQGIDIPFYSPYLPRARPFTIASGKLSLALDTAYQVAEDGDVTVHLGGQATLTGLRVRDNTGEDLFFLPMVRIDLAWADPLAQHAVVSEVALYGPEIFVSRDAQGNWNHARLAPGGRAGVPPPAAAPSPVQTPDLTLEELRIHDAVVHFYDISGRSEFRKEVHNLNLKLNSFSNRGEASPFELQANVTEQFGTPAGSLSANGLLSVAPFALEAQILAKRLALAGLENYLPPEISLRFDAGHVDSDLQLRLATEQQTLNGELAGELGVRALQLSEPQTDTAVLAWESLQLERLALTFAPGPPEMSIGRVALNNYLARIVVTPSGAINLQQVRQTRPESGASAPPPEEAATQEGKPPMQLRIDELVLQGGKLAFRDEHLPNPFSTTLYALGGRISGLSSEAAQRADLDLRGNLENHSPLRLTGTLQPLSGPLFLDVATHLESMELTPLAGYSQTYLGYPISKGKLYLDLDYKIDGKTLKASNQVFLDQFTLGAHQPSDKATKLPVKLAVALLKDGAGEIHLDLPIEGDLDNPEFSVVGVVFQILRNLLVKAATSPLALLSALVGGGEDFSTIDFALGQAQLTESEAQKLAALTEALRKRPALKLEIRGHVDREKDPEAWRQAQLELQLRSLKFQQLSRSQQAALGAEAKVTLSADEISRYLQQAYRNADFPKPRNVLGMAKRLADAEARKLLLANTLAGDREMNALAQERALAVRSYLVETSGMPPERVFLNMEQIDLPPEKGKAAQRVSFGVATD